MFKHLNPWYDTADLQEAARPGLNDHWFAHVDVEDPQHHRKMAAKHTEMSEKHSNKAVHHEEQANISMSKAVEQTFPEKLKLSNQDTIRKHMAKATEHLLDTHDNQLRANHHDLMSKAHLELHDHYSNKTKGALSRANSFANKAANVFE